MMLMVITIRSRKGALIWPKLCIPEMEKATPR